MSTYANLAEEIYNKLVYDDSWGDLWSFDDIKTDVQGFLDTLDSFWYEEDFDREQLLKTIQETFELYKNMRERLYEGQLQLSSNQTMWECTFKNDMDVEWYWQFVETAKKTFMDRTGVEIFCLGRGSRHVCVPHTYQNALQYDKLCEEQRILEKWVIQAYQEKDFGEM